MNELLCFIHNENATTDEWNTKNRKFIPDQWSDPFQIIHRAHGSDLGTNTVKRCLLHRFSCIRFRFLQFHIAPEGKIDDGSKTFKDFYFRCGEWSFCPAIKHAF